MSVVNSTLTVTEWNTLLVTRLLPVNILLGLYFIIGVAGNSLVVYIHCRRLKGKCANRCFIPTLAGADLLVCIIAVPFSFALNLFPVEFPSDLACKVLYFMAGVATIFAATVLAIVALHRYMRVCRPFNATMNKQGRYIMFGIAALVVLVLSVPAMFFYGVAEIRHTSGIIGRRCTSVHIPGTRAIALVWKSLVLLYAVVIISALVVFYSLIGVTVKRRSNFLKMSTSVRKVPKSTDTSLSTEGKLDSNVVSARHGSQDTINLHSSTISKKNDNIKMTHLFVIISAVFIITIIPKLCIMIVESKYELFWLDTQNTILPFYRFLYTLNYVNSIVNPFLYCLFDVKFRHELRVMVKPIYCCNH